jgi:hypothetical protein
MSEKSAEAVLALSKQGYSMEDTVVVTVWLLAELLEELRASRQTG